MTINLNAMQRVSPSPQHGALTAARLPFIPAQNAAAALQQAAAQLGMTTTATNEYRHTDGSWVGLVGNRLERGFGNVVFQGRPADLAALPVAANGAAAGHVASKVPATTSNQTQLQSQLINLGFAQPDPNISYWSHPDTSFVALLASGQLVRGFAGQQVNPAESPAGQQAPAQAAPATPTPATPAAPAGFKADDVLTYPRINASFEDGFLACAALPFLQPANLQNDRHTFLQMGFTEKAPGYFEHKDGSFLSYTSRPTIERGVAKQCFARNPNSPVTGRLAAAAPQWNQIGLAVGNPALASLSPNEILDSKNKSLVDSGFSEVRPGFWRHADQSFVAVAGNNVYYGHGQQVFTGPPNMQTLLAAMPQVQVDIVAVQLAVQLWNMPADAAGAAKHLAGLGFTEQPPGFFRSSTSQLWVALSANSPATCGNGQSRYPNVPTPTLLPQVASSPVHQWMAVAQTHQLKHDTATLAADLAALGYANNGSNLFTHPDGSWVALASGSSASLVRGHGGNVFTDVPAPPPPGTQRPFPQFTSVPPGTWHDWANVHNFACARLPVWGSLNQAQCAMVLTHLGFTHQNGTGFWKHPDGSEVHLAWGGVPTHQATKFQGFDFGQFPYNRQVAALPNTQGGTRDWNTMTQDTQRWLQWAQNPSASPPPFPAFGGP